jgi:hypothetical protein
MTDVPQPDKWKHNYPPDAPTLFTVRVGVPNAPPSPPPEAPIWHYTTFDAYESITKTGVLRASQIQYLNDEQEFRHARDVIEGEVFGRLRALGHKVKSDDARSVRSVYDQPQHIAKCVVCFSHSRDQLSQWRGYGAGVPALAIGFDRKKLDETARALEHGWKLEECIYSADEKRIAVTPIVEAIATNWPAMTLDGTERRDAIRQAVFTKWDEYLHLAPRLKHAGFQEEKELRLISMPYRKDRDGGWGFRRTATLIVPYREFPLFTPGTPPPGLIREILVGPSPHRSTLADALSQLGAARGIAASVRASDIPYR